MSNIVPHPKPNTYKYHNLISNIEQGLFKLPKFQREFVWDKYKSAALLDSIVKGYPIGTFTIWQTQERLANIKNLGNSNIPDTKSGYPVNYILDGQQRLASLFVAIKGLTVNGFDYSKIYLNLEDNSDELVSVNKSDMSISITDLLNKDIGFFIDNYKDEIKKITDYKNRFQTYDFATIELEGYSIEQAVDIFTRINTTGKPLSLFEIMAAMTYDETREFYLVDRYEMLQEELSNSKYVIPDSTILQAISMNLVKKCTRKDILKLNKNAVIEIYDKTVESIKKAIDYLKRKYSIHLSKILPYDALLVPFQYFFFHGESEPDSTQAKMLQEYFWRASLTSRFSSAVETKLEQDCKRIDNILKHEKANYDDLKVTLTKHDIAKYKFSVGEAVCKSILCLYASFKPKSLVDNTEVILNESNLSRSNSKNYHHFFPKAYLKKQNINNSNVIANITLIGAEDNLKIGSKSPSVYTKKLDNNPLLSDTLATHLIDDLTTFGIRTNDYKTFLKKRSERIWEELEKRFK